MLGNEEPETSQPGEIVAHADWYDYEAKYSEGGMELVVPAPDRRGGARAGPRARRRGLPSSPAAAAWPAATSSSSPTATVLVNELNTIPGFTETSVYAKLFEASGIPYPSSATAWSSSRVERHRAARSYEF